MAKSKINKQIAKEMLSILPEDKKKALGNALQRNMILTSAAVLSMGEMTIYKEGWYLVLHGTRCQFAVFAKDNDGELQIIRKPHENKLHKLYDVTLYFNESDFYGF